MLNFNLIFVLGTYAPFDYNTEFSLVAQNGVNVLDSINYFGRVTFTDAEGCSDFNPAGMFIFDRTVSSTSVYPQSWCENEGVVLTSEYLVNTSRYKYVPNKLGQKNPCETPGTFAPYGNSCYGRIMRNGVYQLGFYNAAFEVTFTGTSGTGSTAVVVDDSGYEVLVCI